MPKKTKEWKIKAAWGNIAMVSWGKPSKPPMLLIHGYMDTAATFIPLVEQMNDDYYYVAFDMPGHGKSDPLLSNILVSKIHIIETINIIVEHMKWKRFVVIAHSMGAVISILYHNIYPNKVKKMIILDPRLPLEGYYYVNRKPDLWYEYTYPEYYNNFERWTSGKPRLYSYDKVISLVVRNRSLTEEQADIILSRSLIPMGIDTYKLSWEPRMKKIAAIPIAEDTLYTLMTENIPPTLCIDASESKVDSKANKFAENLLSKCNETLSHFQRVTITGTHDVHITHPELLVPHIEALLKSDSEKTSKHFKSKL